LWIAFAIFIVGLFFGCNLGVILMAILQMARPDRRQPQPGDLCAYCGQPIGDLEFITSILTEDGLMHLACYGKEVAECTR